MTALVVRRLSTKEEIHRIELHNKSERQVERIILGLLRNMNTDEFYVDDSEAYPTWTQPDSDVEWSEV